MDRLSPEDLFKQLEGRKYHTYQELEEAVVGIYNQHLREIPPGFSYLSLLGLAEQKHWILPEDSQGFRVKVTAS